MLSALKKHRYSTYIFIFVTGGLLSAFLISWEDFCPPSHFHGRAFVRPVIFTGGLLFALSFSQEAFVRLDIF
jgi:hypothetical protein